MSSITTVRRRQLLQRGAIALGAGSLWWARRDLFDPQPGMATDLPKEIRLGSFSVAVDYGPYLIARNQGWFEDSFREQGIEVTYTTFQSLPPINESFATNRIDVVFEAEPPAIIAKAAGIDVKIVSMSCSLIQEILVPADSDIESVVDLEGKRVAVLAGTSSHYGLIKLLNDSGLEARDVEVIDLVPPDAQNAFQTGQVDAWAVWPPFVEQEELSGNGRVLPQGDAAINSVMVASGEFAQAYPDLMTQLIQVIEESKQWMIENQTEAKEIVAQELDVPLEVVQRAWPRHDWSAQIDDAIIADIQSKADFFTENEFIQSSVDVEGELIDTSYIPNKAMSS